MRKYYIFAILLVLACAVVLVGEERMRQGPAHDQDAVMDLENIRSSVSAYADKTGALPANLTSVTSINTITKKRLGNYSYSVMDTTHYQVCTTFATTGQPSDTIYNSGDIYVDFAEHPKGYHCFKLKAELPYNSPTHPRTVVN